MKTKNLILFILSMNAVNCFWLNKSYALINQTPKNNFILNNRTITNDYSIQWQEPYVSGETNYQKKLPNLPLEEHGQFLKVPLNYNDPSQGQMSVFFRKSLNFDPTRPTVLFFNGGPGSASWSYRFEKNFPEFNFIYMDQRGTGYSKPDYLEQLQNTDYFTSEFIALDAEAVRRMVNVEKVIVYGHSFGTVVAQIYSSWFSDHVERMILEGVIYSGNIEIWTNPHRIKLLNRFFKKLPADLKKQILEFTARADVPDTWLGTWAQKLMYMPNFEIPLLSYINNILSYYKTIPFVDDSSSDKMIKTENEFFSAYMFNHIACKELSRTSPNASFATILLPNGTFVANSTYGYKTCYTLTGFNSSKIKNYQSVNYPVSVPVVYFQGTDDGSTTAVGAVKHFKNAAKGSAQLILVTKMGHSPMINWIESDYSKPDSALLNIFRKAVTGNQISTSDLKQIPAGFGKWVTTVKPH